MENTHIYNNIEIVYEDRHILVCVKPSGVPVQTRNIGTKDMESILKSYLVQSGSGKSPYLAVIHRLDQPVEGLLVFAKTPSAAKSLNKQITSGSFGKHYLAVTCKIPCPPEGTLSGYLVKDGRTNTSRVCTKDTKDAKYAELFYHVEAVHVPQEKAADTQPLALVRIQLKTGRHHQIRVQFAHAGTPLLGDKKYGSNASNVHLPIALCAFRLSFCHPESKRPMEFTYSPKTPGFSDFTI